MACKLFWLLSLVLCLSAPRILWADCTDYGLHMHWLGGNPSVGTGGAEEDITISGNMAYLAAASNRLQLVNIANPATPVLLSSIALNNGANGVAHTTGVVVVGSRAYVTNAYKGLFIVDVSNPASPVVLGSIDTPGVAEDVAFSGNIAYVADYSSGLQVIDIANPAAPVIIGSVDTPGNAFGVALFGSIAYVADEFVGVHVIDISNPHSPIILGTVGNPGTPQVPGNAQDLVAVGTNVYAADGKQGFLVIDASNPTAPVLVGSVDTPGYAWDLTVQGTQAYLADDTGGLSVVDFTNPASPTIVGKKLTPQNLRAVAVSGTTGFCLDPAYGLETIDLTRMIPVPVVGSLDLNPTSYPPEPLAVSGSLACVLDDSDLVTIDVSNPALPQIRGRIRTPARAQDVALSGTLAFVTYAGTVPPIGPDFGGLLVIDVSAPNSPQVLGHWDLLASGTIAVFSPTRLFLAGTGKFPDGSTSTNHFWVIDVSDPHHPTLVGGQTPPYPPIPLGLLTASGTLAYVSHSNDVSGRIEVVDVSNPDQPALIGGIDFPDWSPGRVRVSGIYGYAPVSKQGIGGLQNGAAIMQTSPFPESPRLLSIVYTPGGTGGLGVSGTSVYAAAGWNGYSAQLGGGLYVIDASTPTAPKIVGNSEVKAQNIVVSGGLVYATRFPRGLTIVPTQCEASTSVPDGPAITDAMLGSAFPNPTRAEATTIPFTVSRRGAVKLRILDVNGREVRRFVNEMMDAGEQRVQWDGRNERGEPVPPGIYVYELRASGLKAARKLVRLR